MTPGGAADRHLNELLTAVGIAVNPGNAPQGTTGTYVVSEELGPEGVRNEAEGASNFEFLKRVFAVNESGVAPEEEAEALTDALSPLVDGERTWATTEQGPYTVSSMLLDPYESAPVDGGRQFRQEGGDFRILVRPLP